MEQHAEILAPGSVRFERLLPGPLERVWDYLVDPDKRALWLCGGATDTTVGGDMKLEFDNSRLSGPDDDAPPEKYREFNQPVSFDGRVTQFDPPNVFAHTWEFAGQASEVRYELEAVDDKVRLVLIHTRLATGEEVRNVCAGWHAHLGILADLLGGRRPRPFWKSHTALEAEYTERLGS